MILWAQKLHALYWKLLKACTISENIKYFMIDQAADWPLFWNELQGVFADLKAISYVLLPSQETLWGNWTWIIVFYLIRCLKCNKALEWKLNIISHSDVNRSCKIIMLILMNSCSHSWKFNITATNWGCIWFFYVLQSLPYSQPIHDRLCMMVKIMTIIYKILEKAI